jgi:hypothetical protein
MHAQEGTYLFNYLFLKMLWARPQYKKLFNLWRILRDVFRKHHECALKPKTLQRFVKFVAILRRIPFFVTNTAAICLVCRDYMTYSYFSSRTCIDGYWSPKHHDDLLNSSQYGTQHSDVLADSSRSQKKQPPHQHLGPTHTATQAPPHPSATSLSHPNKKANSNA